MTHSVCVPCQLLLKNSRHNIFLIISDVTTAIGFGGGHVANMFLTQWQLA